MPFCGVLVQVMLTPQTLAADQLEKFRDRFKIPVDADTVAQAAFFKPAEDSPEMQYLHSRRQALGGYLPSRKLQGDRLEIPDLSMFEVLLKDVQHHPLTGSVMHVDFLEIAMDEVLRVSIAVTLIGEPL